MDQASSADRRRHRLHHEATLHRYAVIPEGFRGCLGRRLALVRPRSDIADPNFLHFMMLGPEWRQTVEDRVISGSTVDRVPIIDFPQFPIRLPPLRTQRRIAAVLSAFDELIEINEQRIELLADIARSLYREWFVRFRFPGYDDANLVNSELGPIPEGWEVRPVGDVLDVLGGGTPSKKRPDYWLEGHIPWFTPSDLTRSRRRFVDESEHPITALGLARSSARLFPPGSVLMTSRATLGVLAIASKEATCNQGFIVIPPVDGVPPAFIYEWLASQAAEREQIATGATFKEITRGAFKRFPPRDPHRARRTKRRSPRRRSGRRHGSAWHGCASI